MSHYPKYSFDPATGIAKCEIMTKDGVKYIGTATCCNADADMMSEKTGLIIAESRAAVQALRGEKARLQGELSGLRSLYYSTNTSKHYNKKNYMERMLNRQIKMRENDIAAIKAAIDHERNFLSDFIAEKDAFYQKVRSNRKV